MGTEGMSARHPKANGEASQDEGGSMSYLSLVPTNIK